MSKHWKRKYKNKFLKILFLVLINAFNWIINILMHGMEKEIH